MIRFNIWVRQFPQGIVVKVYQDQLGRNLYWLSFEGDADFYFSGEDIQGLI